MSGTGELPPPSERHARASAALGAGDPLAAIQLVAGEEGAHSLAIRAIALAQLGEHDDAKRLLDRAASAFERAGESLYVARARAASAEVVAADRELGAALDEFDAACAALDGSVDGRNAAWTRLVRARLLVLLGDLPRARKDVEGAAEWATEHDDPLVGAAAELARAEACARELRATLALEALARAAEAARRNQGTGHASLEREIELQRRGLVEPVARLESGGGERAVDAVELEPLLTGQDARRVVVDALRRRWVVREEAALDLARRGVLFELLLALARAWPEAAPTRALVRELFECDETDESHLARLKTEIARLRRALGDSAQIRAEGGSWRLVPAGAAEPVVVSPLENDRASLLEALLWDGAAWSARSLAAAAGVPLRTVQRELGALVDAGRARALGGSRSMRYARVDRRLGFAPQMFLVGISGWP